jgi:hypothetical protein
MICLSYYLLCFLFNKIGEEEGRTGSAWRRGCGTNSVYNVSKHKNHKIKGEKKNKQDLKINSEKGEEAMWDMSVFLA